MTNMFSAFVFTPQPKKGRAVITPEERALIDAAIAEGRVKKIPYGVSTLNFNVKYDSEQGRLVYEVPRDWNTNNVVKSPLKGSKPWEAAAVKRTQEKDRKIAYVAALVQEGTSAYRICELVGCTANMVDYYKTQARKLGLLPPHDKSKMQHFGKRGEQIAAIVAARQAGVPYSKLCEVTGLSSHRMRSLHAQAVKDGLIPPTKYSHAKQGTQNEADD